MAEVIVKYDTMTKKVEVTQNGVAFDNITAIHFYQKIDCSNWDCGCEYKPGEHSMSIHQEEVKLDGTRTTHHTYASLKTSTFEGMKKLLGGTS